MNNIQKRSNDVDMKCKKNSITRLNDIAVGELFLVNSSISDLVRRHTLRASVLFVFFVKYNIHFRITSTFVSICSIFRLGASGKIAAFYFPPCSLCTHFLAAGGKTIKNRTLSV